MGASPSNFACRACYRYSLGWFKNPVSSQTEKLMAATNFSDYLDLKRFLAGEKSLARV